MADIDLTELDAGFGELFDTLAGDPITVVAADGTQTEVQTLRWQPDSDASSFEGLEIDAAGMRDGGERNVLFLKARLTAAAVEIDPTVHFVIDGERWDLAKDRPIRRDLAPLFGWQGLLMVTIRCATELNSSTPGTGFSLAE